jgi:hypothetical protein
MMKAVESRYIASPSACSGSGTSDACAPVQPDRDQPDQRHDDERQHEFLVGGGLVGLKRRPQALGEQRRIGLREPQSAGGADDGADDQEHPRRWPIQRTGRGEQQRAEGDDEDGILQQQFRDHARVPFPPLRHDRVILLQTCGVGLAQGRAASRQASWSIRVP